MLPSSCQAIRNIDMTRHVLHPSVCHRCAKAGLTVYFHDVHGVEDRKCMRCVAHKYGCTCRVPTKA